MAEPSPDLAAAGVGLIGPALSALVGVLMRHSQLVQRGERRFLSPFLLLEVPTVAGMGIVGGGVGSYLELAPSVTWAVAAVLGWLGPQALALLVRAVAQRAGVKIDPDKAAP
ncbi:phage holin family protein [Azospirillum sp. A1-3]|uniref:phage holin family protein n=1 Tax=Azospirillum sp. A1-3 TaxID=185874 RepID=UPI0020778931|nr:phage holin family protein [Azospirillum sp. A1-3]